MHQCISWVTWCWHVHNVNVYNYLTCQKRWTLSSRQMLPRFCYHPAQWLAATFAWKYQLSSLILWQATLSCQGSSAPRNSGKGLHCVKEVTNYCISISLAELEDDSMLNMTLRTHCKPGALIIENLSLYCDNVRYCPGSSSIGAASTVFSQPGVL